MIAIKKYSKHPSILKINTAPGNIIGEKFSFCHTTIDNIYNEIKALNSLKSSPKDSIPSKVNCGIFGEKLFTDFNLSVDSGLFPSNLQYADVTPVYKKGERADKNNYRPISLLPALSKIFEKLLYYQLHNYIESKLSKFQCGFRKGFNAQHCLIVRIEKWKTSLNKCSVGVLLTDLSKAFDCLALLLATLGAYGFYYISLKLIHRYLISRYQRVRVNSNYS